MPHLSQHFLVSLASLSNIRSVSGGHQGSPGTPGQRATGAWHYTCRAVGNAGLPLHLPSCLLSLHAGFILLRLQTGSLH